MAQTAALVDALKNALRSSQKTYADVAAHLRLSEASVKRMFAQRHFSLQRLDAICALLELEISDLVALMDESRTSLTELSELQEQEIVDSVELLLVLISLINRWTVADILNEYDLKETDVIKLLAKLDRLKIIDLLPNNRVRMRLAPTFKWRENGPIQRFFQQRVEKEFFKSRFSKPTERLICINGLMTDQSNASLQKRMQRLANDFHDCAQDDSNLPRSATYGTTMVLAIRRWEYSAFEKLKRTR